MKTVAEVAKELQISQRRVIQLIEDGRIDAKKMGRDWIILSYDNAKDRKNGRPMGKSRR